MAMSIDTTNAFLSIRGRVHLSWILFPDDRVPVGHLSHWATAIASQSMHSHPCPVNPLHAGKADLMWHVLIGLQIALIRTRIPNMHYTKSTTLLI